MLSVKGSHVRTNSQDVGLEAAIIERVRNSSLVECAWRRQRSEAQASYRSCGLHRRSLGSAGRAMVGERSVGGEA